MHERALIDYLLHLGDNALVLGHRNSEWTGHGPILEQDIALSNIALDLIGQARYYYQYASGRINAMPTDAHLVQCLPGNGAHPAQGLPGNGKTQMTEDALAFLRDAWDFRNCLLVEQDNGDWGKTILRQFFFSAYQYALYRELQHSRDSHLSAIAAKSLKEVTYHLRWSGEWVIRLGDGTAESHARMEHGLTELWKYTGELFLPADYEKALAPAGIAVDLAELRPVWEEKTGEVLRTAGLETKEEWMQKGGKQGKHTEALGYLLAEMQFLQRAYPACDW
jgi:ring-1,2-phenylacetyl-CoA epoxidase subunit PaaC